jgi:serine/threonine protein kinase
MLKRFEREAKALARLTHPNIVGVIDFGEYEGSPYLVMPYLPGGTLKQRLGKPIPWQDAARILLPIARALQFAHEQGIVHRDVKPSNILITLSGEAILTDFGIAKILESEEATALTGTGMGMGTPEYMAPEQWTGKGDLRSDIYALGVVFYEMVTGHKPFMADTPPAIMLKQATEPLPSPRQYVPDLPESVERVLLKAMARQVEDRYTDMAAFSEAIEDLLNRQKKVKLGTNIPKTILRIEKLAPASQETVAQEDTSATRLQEVTRDEFSATVRAPLAKTNNRWMWLFGIGGALCLALAGILGGFVIIPILQQTHQHNSPTQENQSLSFLNTSSVPTPTYIIAPTKMFTNMPIPTKITTEIQIPILTATPRPRLFNFQSCPESCNGQNNQSTFPEKTAIIYLQWQYENIPANASYIRISSFGGLEWARYECTWTNSSIGTEYRTFTEPMGIRSGTWTLTVIINGETLLSETIHVQGNWDYWDPAGYFNTCGGKR